ncbi:MAG: L-2-amino-thiazoline-4-carboxylic acid hydrolase [Lachnospiraceae bacterium]
METMEKTEGAVSMKDNESKEPVSWSTLFCRLFANIAKEVVDKFGEEGEKAIKDGVWAFGVERGRNIAERARANGCEIDTYSYLSNYDMGRGDDFTADNTYGDNQVEQLFSQCGFADQWLEDGTERYGKLYCDVIDPAIAKGYSENLECIHDKRIYEDGVCSFCFRMKKKDE